MNVDRSSIASIFIGIGLFAVAQRSPAGKPGRVWDVLYNGIVLPANWPPRMKQLPRDPVAPPYLKSRPVVVPIDVGRQLFVDDFLIERTTLKQTWHTATYYAHNPVLRPDRPWETNTPANPTAMVFSDGVCYDPQDRPVRFRFHLRRGSLYAFWVSPEKSGASHGYVAAGGPGLSGPIDTVGRKTARETN